MDEQLERRSIPTTLSVQTRHDGDKKQVIEGYAALFDTETVIPGWYKDFRESIAPGAFEKTIASGRRIVSLFNHDVNILLGSTTGGTMRLKEDKKGLWIEVDPPDTQAGRDVVEGIRRGDITGQSFMFTIKRQEWTISDDENELDSRVITEVELFEAGPVVFPAYEETSVGLRSRGKEDHKAAREEWERNNKPSEPVVVKGVYPDVVLAKVSALRSRYTR